MVIDYLADLSSPFPLTALTIGNFDGLHRGHQSLLNELTQAAKEKSLNSAVLLFEPQPLEFFLPESPPARLTNLSEKIHWIKHYAPTIDKIVVQSFDNEFSECSAVDFLDEYLIKKLSVQYLLIGEDFRFGKNREGDIQFLMPWAKKNKILLKILPAIHDEEKRISSTRVRQALQENDFSLATRLLGRPYSLTGQVTEGAKRGQTIGVPTANVSLDRLHTALHGVFAVQVRLANQKYSGVANLGSRPTVDGKNTLLEVHLFNFSNNIYGQQIQVEFMRKLREERRFSDFSALRTQIEKDIQDAKKFFLGLTHEP